MNHIDITFDLETAGRTANAAVMQVAAVAWRRDADDNPFYEDDMERYIYNEYIDLRTCLVEGFEFEPATVQWWSQRSEAAKRAVCAGLPEPVEEVFVRFLHWIECVKKATGADTVNLWAQGSDFDTSILRNICHRYDIDLEDTVAHTQFRDCRTIILEGALVEAGRLHMEAVAKAETLIAGQPFPQPVVTQQAILDEPAKAYVLFDPLPDDIAQGSEAHDALYDALRSSWNTWQALRWLSGHE